ncbi:MAG: hypothetical protein NT154_45840 [Verrucomicrobia bacterium]|nr:hypothetical protein [Verrucomicrobiota bacterium]
METTVPELASSRRVWQRGIMPAEITYVRLLTDQEICMHLEQQDTLLFVGLKREWQQIEHQVERLGFGDRYVVSQIAGRRSLTKVSPLQARSIVTGI